MKELGTLLECNSVYRICFKSQFRMFSHSVERNTSRECATTSKSGLGLCVDVGLHTNTLFSNGAISNYNMRLCFQTKRNLNRLTCLTITIRQFPNKLWISLIELMSEQKVLYNFDLHYTQLYIKNESVKYAFRLVDLGRQSKFKGFKTTHQFSLVATWKITSKYSMHNFMHKYAFPNFERNGYIESRYVVPGTVTS